LLPRQHRLHRSADLRQVLRRGRRFAIPEAVVHITLTEPVQTSRIGLVTAKIVGNAVIRHQVARAIRHGAAEFLLTYPTGVDLAVRALAGSDQLSVTAWTDLMTQAVKKAHRAVAAVEQSRTDA